MIDLKVLNIEEIREKVKNRQRNSRTKKFKSTTARAIKIFKILNRDNFECTICKSKDNLTIDHIEGRKFAKHNNAQKYCLNKCITLCKECHMKKNGWRKDV